MISGALSHQFPYTNQEMRERLERDGHVTVVDLLTAAEVERFRDIVRSATATAKKVRLPPGNEVYQRAFDQRVTRTAIGSWRTSTTELSSSSRVLVSCSSSRAAERSSP